MGSNRGTITASYATGVADGGTGTDLAFALYGNRPAVTGTGLTASYGFGTPVNVGNAGGSNGIAHPAGVTAASGLTADNAGMQWNQASSDTMDAWDFGTTAQAPALRYADYDGAGNDYSCGNDAVLNGIPTVVAAPSGPLTITCGSTLLPGQR